MTGEVWKPRSLLASAEEQEEEEEVKEQKSMVLERAKLSETLVPVA